MGGTLMRLTGFSLAFLVFWIFVGFVLYLGEWLMYLLGGPAPWPF